MLFLLGEITVSYTEKKKLEQDLFWNNFNSRITNFTNNEKEPASNYAGLGFSLNSKYKRAALTFSRFFVCI